MSFLTPLFFLGLAALAVPVLIHLIQRERKRVVEFPSLMFIQRIPYQSVRRRRIHNWLLLLVRLAALALLVLAFARPFLRRPDLAAAAAGGAREVVVLLDTSYSMGYGARWDRARTRAREILNGLSPSDRASLVTFSTEPEVQVRSTADRGALLGALSTTEVSAGSTRFGPALKLAGTILSESALPRREAVLITDFQRSGWQGAEGVRLPGIATLTPVGVGADENVANVAVTPVSLQRSMFSNQERITVTAGVLNRSTQPASNVAVTLEIDGRPVETQHATAESGGSASVTFGPVTIAARNTRGAIRIPADGLARDNAFFFTVSPSEPVHVTVVDADRGDPAASLYLTRALSIGDAPRFEVTTRQASALTDADLQRSRVLVLDDVPVTASLADRIGRYAQRGGGVFVIVGTRATWPSESAALLPGVPGDVVDRSRGDAGRLGTLEFGHPVFELFRAPRTGDFSAARFYSYRALNGGVSGTPPPAGTPAAPAQAPDAVLARFDDGAPALVERRTGAGRVMVWTSTLDLTWNDLAVKPVFLPFMQRVARHLSGYTEPEPWHTVGQVFNPAGDAPPASADAARLALTPSGRRVELDGEGPDVLPLSEQGFYEVRSGRPSDAAVVVASNVDLTESDLTAMDPREIVAAAAGEAGGTRRAGADTPATPDAQERSQRLWWYLLFAGVVLLGVETWLSTRATAVS